jgi:hypothetical protein
MIMKTSLLFIFSLGISIALHAQISFTTATTPVTCHGGNDGTATITSISGGFTFNNSTKGLLISEIFTDTSSGSDSPFEWVELVATRAINFVTTPYTIIFSNNGTATANGWIHGTNKTYAFQISTGSVTPGQVVYVGGTSMRPMTNQLRVINTGTTAGDGGIGTAVVAGVLGNGGASVDGIAVFNAPVATITSSTVPIDAIFFGDAIGSAFVTGATGYEMPVNDYYNGGKLDTTDYFLDTPASLQDKFIKANFGVYNTNTNTFSQPRQWVVTSTFTNLSTSILLDGLYNVSWSNACTSVYNPNLTAGNYTFTISDALSTFTNGNVNVADGPNVNLGATADDTLACEGQAIVLSASNADILIWDNGDTSTTTNASVDFDTTFYVTGIDTVSGCIYTDSVFIDVNQIPTVLLVLAFDSVCNNGGAIILSGGTPAGGTFSGSGVSGGNLDPTLLSGTNQVDYMYSDANGCSSTASDNYVVVNCLGIEDEEDLHITIYPNPATDFVWVDTEIKDLKYSIMDLSGKVVITGNLNTANKIDMQNLHTGIYIITLQNSNQHKQIRLIKR